MILIIKSAARSYQASKHLHNLQTFLSCLLFQVINQLSKIAVRLMISDMFILYHLFYFRKQRYFLYLLNSMSQLWLNFSWCLLDTVSLAWNCCYERKLDVMTFLDVNVIVNEIIRQELENLLLDWCCRLALLQVSVKFTLQLSHLSIPTSMHCCWGHFYFG